LRIKYHIHKNLPLFKIPIKKGPTPNNNQYSSYLFFCTYIVVGIWFFLNLLLGVIFLSYSIEEKKILKKNLNENQTKWLEVIKIITTTEPLKFSIPQKGIRRQIFNMINGVPFRAAVAISLIVNVAFLLAFHEGQSMEMTYFMNLFYYFIWSFYFMEMVFKVFSYGFCSYLSHFQHKIEILIVICNFVDIVCSDIFINYLFNDNNLQLRFSKLTILLRLTIFLRVVRYMKSIENLYNTLRFAFPLLFNLFLIVTLVIYIYSIIGCQYFNSVITGNIVDENINFANVFNGMMTLFKCVTCDNWADIMLDFSKTPPDCIEGVDCGSRTL